MGDMEHLPQDPTVENFPRGTPPRKKYKDLVKELPELEGEEEDA